MKLKKIIALSLIATTSLATTACQGGANSRGENLFTKENIGGIMGAAGGAWIGSNVGKGKGQIVGIAAGTLLGAALGKSIGSSLDKADMQYYHRTSQHALENTKTGTTTTWSNPDSGNSGSITPLRTYQSQRGIHCREYSQTIMVGGQPQQAYGTACRQPDGSWKITE